MKIPLGQPRELQFKIPPKALKITGLVISCLLLVLFIAGIIAFSKRDAILKAAIERAIKKAKADYDLKLEIKNARFSGIKTVVIDQVSVVPDHRDSLVYLDGLRVSIRLLPLIFGKIKLAEVTLGHGKINLVKKDSTANYDFLFHKKKKDPSSSRKSLADLADNLLNTFLNKVPDEMNIHNLDLLFTENENRLRFYTTSAIIHNGNLESTILVNDHESTWHIAGNVDPDDKQFDLHLYADGKKVELPLLYQKYALRISFDDAAMRLNTAGRDGDELRISANCSVKNLLVNHPKIAANDIIVPNGSIDADVLVGENFIALDSSSVIHLKKIDANPYLKYTLSPVKIYEMKLHTGELDAQQLFESFPTGMFESLEGMRVSGKLKYSLNFKLDSSLPDSVEFNSSLQKTDFRILGWGKTNLQKINSSFLYTPFESGKPVRSILIGPENPEFVPIGNISPNIRNAVLTAEDPTFYTHHGFVELAIRRSIATDYKAKTFKQGGSTISMQLVKNVYLNRQKTMARKIEEIFIVWLIENNHLSNKQRMFEAYLNLIEWGPNIYGISEASHYYFNKYPSDLNLGESIFLASIVPRPKKAMYFFEPGGGLRPGLKNYFRLIGGLMARRGFADRDTSGTYGFYDVRLKESLRTLIAPDSLISDSTLMSQDEDEDSHTFLERMLTHKEPEKKMDTISIHDLDKLKVVPRDTVKTRAEKRKERKEEKKRQKEEKQQVKAIGPGA